jgi:hypothetical protein
MLSPRQIGAMDLCTPSTPPPNDEFNNKRNCTSASPACLYGIYRNNFTCTLQQTGTIRHLWYLLLTTWFVCLVIKAILKVNTSCSWLLLLVVVAASAVTVVTAAVAGAMTMFSQQLKVFWHCRCGTCRHPDHGDSMIHWKCFYSVHATGCPVLTGSNSLKHRT